MAILLNKFAGVIVPTIFAAVVVSGVVADGEQLS